MTTNSQATIADAKMKAGRIMLLRERRPTGEKAVQLNLKTSSAKTAIKVREDKLTYNINTVAALTFNSVKDEIADTVNNSPERSFTKDYTFDAKFNPKRIAGYLNKLNVKLLELFNDENLTVFSIQETPYDCPVPTDMADQWFIGNAIIPILKTAETPYRVWSQFFKFVMMLEVEIASHVVRTMILSGSTGMSNYLAEICDSDPKIGEIYNQKWALVFSSKAMNR